MIDVKKEAGRLQTRIAHLGAATVIRDDAGKLHAIPGFNFEIVGTYQEGITTAELRDDISFLTEGKS